jgi:hypothetical protein
LANGTISSLSTSVTGPNTDILNAHFRLAIMGITDIQSADPIAPIHEYKLIFPESFEAVGRKRSVARSVLDIAVTEIGLQPARIDAVICQLVTAGVAQHTRVRLDT